MRVLAWPAYRNDSNPYTGLLYSSIAAQEVQVDEFRPWSLITRRYDVWHVHWPERGFTAPKLGAAIARSLLLFLLITIARWRNVSIVWTVHNLKPHEQVYPWLERLVVSHFLRSLSGFIVLSPSSEMAVRKAHTELMRTPGVVIPHGHYMDSYPNQITSLEARRKLGLGHNEVVLLFLGQIRNYKNVPHLLETFRSLKLAHVRLIVAGESNDVALEEVIRIQVAEDQRVLLWLRRVPDEEIQVFMNASDLVVLPYSDVLNSGSAILALSFDRPVLVPELGAMKDLQAAFGPDIVRTYSGELSPPALADALRRPEKPVQINEYVRQRLDWAAIAEATVVFYRNVIGG